MNTTATVTATVTSADGTTIAYDTVGSGPAVILVGGAFQYRSFDPRTTEIARALADRFTVYHYDRRGRGDSGDTPPYAVAREVEDIAALIEAAGGLSRVDRRWGSEPGSDAYGGGRPRRTVARRPAGHGPGTGSWRRTGGNRAPAGRVLRRSVSTRMARGVRARRPERPCGLRRLGAVPNGRALSAFRAIKNGHEHGRPVAPPRTDARTCRARRWRVAGH